MKRLIIGLLGILPTLVYSQNEPDMEKMLSQKRYTSAENTAREMLKTQPANTANWYWLSQVLLQKKDSIGLAGLKTQLPATTDPWISIALGNIELTAGNHAAARAHFENAVSATKSKNKDVLAAVARVNIYNANGDKLYAIEKLEKAIRRNKKDAALHTLIGEAHFRLKNGNEAYTALTRATGFDQNYAPAYYALGMIFSTQNNEPVYLDYFNKAVTADPAFAPALYQLYYHYYSKDINKSYDYFTRYMKASDPDEETGYQLADMLYLTKRYPEAIAKANDLLKAEDAKNRLHKLKAYIYKELNAPDSAILFMNRYFARGADTAYLLKDYAFMTELFSSKGMMDSAIAYREKSLPLIHDEVTKRNVYKTIANHFAEKKDYAQQSLWLGRYYGDNANATNVDLFNWGISLYQSRQFNLADSVFGHYAEKYPDQVFGYYWQARSKSAIDSAMEQGIAVPVYRKLVEVAVKDTTNETNKRYLVEAYGYIAAYTANTEKNYKSAIGYFEKLLELDPANNDAKKYIAILEDALDSSSGSK